MLLLSTLFGPNKLSKYIQDGIISEMTHPVYWQLAILNYTHKAQHENIWDDVTEVCRGLIYDKRNGSVVARPFRKFFNLNTSFRPETMEEALPCETPETLEKLDGSLGILYQWDGMPYIATRGSFASEQAKWATAWFQDKIMAAPYSSFNSIGPEGYTPIFEIIYKENRIVVSYDFEGLVLLGFVNVLDGSELPYEDVVDYARLNNFRCAKKYPFDLSIAKTTNDPNIEGFVLQYRKDKEGKELNPPLRIKVKTEDYCRLHKVITGLNTKGIWEHLREGKHSDLLWMPAIHNKPFVSWCIHYIKIFQQEYQKIEDEAIRTYGRAAVQVRRNIARDETFQRSPTRKEYAILFTEMSPKLCPILFAMFDGKDYKPFIWKMLEPKIIDGKTFIRNADEDNGI